MLIRIARSFRHLVLPAALLAVSCSKSNTSPTPTPSAPFSQTDLRAGTGADASAGKRVTVNYTGWLYDPARAESKGTQFDTSIGKQPIAFVLGTGAVIRGWDQGLAGMKVGGLRRLVIPPDLAYGAAGNGPVPPNATIVFDVELLAVQ